VFKCELLFDCTDLEPALDCEGNLHGAFSLITDQCCNVWMLHGLKQGRAPLVRSLRPTSTALAWATPPTTPSEPLRSKTCRGRRQDQKCLIVGWPHPEHRTKTAVVLDLPPTRGDVYVSGPCTHTIAHTTA
jgi:hypothetical protein